MCPRFALRRVLGERTPSTRFSDRIGATLNNGDTYRELLLAADHWIDDDDDDEVVD